MDELIKEWGYIVLFLYSFGGGFIALIAAGVLSYTGDLNIYITLLVAGSSNFLGDQFLFLMARNNKHFAKDIMKKHRRKVAYAHLMLKKQGSKAIFLQKYIYGVKTLIPLAIGLTKYEQSKFLFYNFFATIVWVLVFGISSYMLGETVMEFVEEFKTYGVIFIIFLLLLIGYGFKKL